MLRDAEQAMPVSAAARGARARRTRVRRDAEACADAVPSGA